MLGFLLSGDGTVISDTTTRAQLPLLLAQTANLTTIAVNQATETDEAFDITVVVATTALIPVQQATESDFAADMTVVMQSAQFVPVDFATETDEAFDITVFEPVDVTLILDTAEETDESFSIVYRASALFPVNIDSSLLLTPVNETQLDLTPVTVS
jgi:hypothetical protein